MSYNFRDFIFDLGKETLKDSQIASVKKDCTNLRHKILALPKEDAVKAETIINKIEERKIAEISSQAEAAAYVKELLKQMGF